MSTAKNYKNIIIDCNSKLRDAIKIINSSTYYNMAIILDNLGKFLGILTNGDVTRAILSGKSLDESVLEIVNLNAVTLKNSDLQNSTLKMEAVGNLLKRKGIFIPLLDEEGHLIDLIHYLDLELNMNNLHGKFFHKSILVVGGAGYLGSVLIKKLLDQGYGVICLDNFIHNNYAICDFLKTYPNLKIAKVDMRNISFVMRTLEGVNAVIHLAAVVGDAACSSSPKDTIEINYLSTKMLAEAARYSQVNRFIFASSCSVYGKSEYLLDENSPLNPVSFYAESKLKSEQGILEMVDEYFSPTIMRMATLFGFSYRMRFDLVINTLIMKAVTGGKIDIYGGNQWRPFLHVSDAANVFISILETPIEKVKGQVYNVGSAQLNYQIKQLGEIIKNALPNTIVEIKDGSHDVRNYKVCFKKLEQELNFNKTLDIKDAIVEIKNFINNNKIDVTDEQYSNNALNYTNMDLRDFQYVLLR